MKYSIISILLLFFWAQILLASKIESYPAEVSAAFNKDCDKLLITKIQQAQKTIYGAIYAFTSKDIAQALIAQTQKAKIHLKIDKKQAELTYTKTLISIMQKSGIKITLIAMKKDTHMHHKFMIIDKKNVITGSFNWTHNASTNNYENIVYIQSPIIAEMFMKEWASL